MSDYTCVVMVVCLIVGFILGRWRIPDYSGDVIVSGDSCTFALDIPKEEIAQRQELVFRVVDGEKTN